MHFIEPMNWMARLAGTVRAAALGCALAAGIAGCSGEEPAASTGDAAVPRAPRESEKHSAPPPLEGLEELDENAAARIREASAAVSANADDAQLWYELAQLYHANEQLLPARRCYRQTVLREERMRAWYYLALVDETLGATDKAMQYLGLVTQREPFYVPAHWRLGLLKLAAGDLNAAESSLRTALQIAPRDPASVVGMSRVHLQRGRADEAITLLEGHMERFPEDGNARFLLGSAYRDAGRMNEANQALAGGAGGDPIVDDPWYAEVVDLREGYRTDFLRAVALVDDGRPEEAIEQLEALLDKRPEDTLIHINLQRAYRMRGQLDRGIDLLLDARRIDPARDQILFHLAGAFQEKAREGGSEADASVLRLALDAIDEACQLSPTYAAAHALRGDVLLDLDRPQEAAAAFSRAAELDRAEPLWQQKAGFTLVRYGQWKAALPFLRRLEVLEPDSVIALQVLGTALANSGELAEAKSTLERARTLAPDNEEVLQALEGIERLREANGEGAGS